MLHPFSIRLPVHCFYLGQSDGATLPAMRWLKKTSLDPHFLASWRRERLSSAAPRLRLARIASRSAALSA